MSTPSLVAAAVRSIRAMCACANGERTRASSTHPGTSMSAKYRPRPASRRSSSSRGRRAPMYEGRSADATPGPAASGIAVPARPPTLCPSGIPPPRGADGRHDVVVAGTAAQVAGKQLADRVVVRVVFRVSRGERHEDPGRAEPALEAVVVLEGPLERPEALLRSDALDGREARAIGLRREHDAGPDRVPIHQ